MAIVELDPLVREFTAKERPMLIGGEWVPAMSGNTFETYDPSTGEVLAHVAEGDKADIDRAVKAARRAFDEGPWGKLTPSERGRLVHRIGDLIMEHADELATLETLDNGKPFAVAKAADIPLSADLFWYMSGWATKLDGRTTEPHVPYKPGSEWHAYTRREPVGVVGQIIPWNFPLLMAAWKLGPALSCGNAVVLKPAEQTPLSVLRLGELILEAGIPPGVVNIVPGYGETAGAALAAHPDVDKVAFTGSTEVGKLIVEAAAGNLKKVSLELGGKSPNIVFPDADMEKAIPGAAMATFFNHGQCCIAGTRLFVQKSAFDDVVAGVADHAKSLKVGPGMAEDTDMGPLVSKEQFERVTAYLQKGATEGARAVAGGRALERPGYFVEPTLLVDTEPDMSIWREEIFGPVLAATPFDDLDELARQANDTPYGLGAGVWTQDISKAHKLAKLLKAGTVYVNTYNIFPAEMPFGGYKESGWGREMGPEVLESYTETKSVICEL
ncbi:MAG: aldehyde dehydrogenase family protein [Solirubrobacterales bacterium]|nr:aldehyde dehydrogenase family protein [Solirubrobacterales bacterium]MBV9535756.1 aldehyde dehydrogenase family protein [Solirubrobacterales bacterium]